MSPSLITSTSRRWHSVGDGGGQWGGNGKGRVREAGREGERVGRREGGKEGRREGGKEGRREEGKEGRKKGGMEGGKEGRRKGGREGRRERQSYGHTNVRCKRDYPLPKPIPANKKIQYLGTSKNQIPDMRCSFSAVETIPENQKQKLYPNRQLPAIFRSPPRKPIPEQNKRYSLRASSPPGTYFVMGPPVINIHT